ncbi:MAG: DMT family transporter [Candidatus Thiodiazotropha sp.]
MSVPAAFLGVVLIWGTTPLAIQWSGQGVGFLFGVTGRMLIGVTLAMLVLRLMGLRLPWHEAARRTYLIAGLGIYLSMTLVYWSAQYIPSAWISLVFGLSPIATGLMARVWLQEPGLTLARLLAVLVSLAGLATVFSVGIQAGTEIALGLVGVVLSVISHSASAVWIKRIDAQLHGLAVTTGGLMVAVPLFLVSWFLQGQGWPEAVGVRALAAICYLGVIGSVLGFALYYYILRHLETTKVALITLITPLIALFAGAWFNAEPITPQIWIGTALILAGLAGFEAAAFRRMGQWRPVRVRESEGQ